jgi:hypothetical protein
MSPQARARGHTAFKPLPMGPVLRISDPGRSVQAAEIAVSCCRKASAAGTTPERSCARTVVCPQTGPASVFCWVTKRPGHSGWKFSGSKFSGQGGDLLRKDQKRMLTATQASRGTDFRKTRQSMVGRAWGHTTFEPLTGAAGFCRLQDFYAACRLQRLQCHVAGKQQPQGRLRTGLEQTKWCVPMHPHAMSNDRWLAPKFLPRFCWNQAAVLA